MQDVIARLSASPGAVLWPGHALGADTDAILVGELGLDPAGLKLLRDRNVLR